MGSANKNADAVPANRTGATTQFLRFLAVSGFAAAVNFGSRIVLSHWLPYATAIVFAYLLGLITAFVLNRLFVFADATNRLHHQALWFIAVNAVALLQTLFVSLLLKQLVLPRLGISWHAEEIAHAVGIATPIFTSYLGHKHLSFSARTPSNSRGE
ncbi:GtrA family protein [Rudaea sp.]|uniref:GtrA family protein n=1 Tax=Rudaea sp. TaxID=2136325 RepID=UPI002ECFF8BF